MPSNSADEYYKEKRALIWACLLPATVMMLVGSFTNNLALWAMGLFLSAPGFAGALIYLDMKRRDMKRLEQAYEDALDTALLIESMKRRREHPPSREG